MVADEDEQYPVLPKLTRFDRGLTWLLRALFVLAVSLVLAGLLAGLFVMLMLLAPAAHAAEADLLPITDQHGNLLLRCTPPTLYLTPPGKAIVCDLGVFHHGFEQEP